MQWFYWMPLKQILKMTLLGHEDGSNKSEGKRTYMHDYDVSNLKNVIELIEYEGVKAPPLTLFTKEG